MGRLKFLQILRRGDAGITNVGLKPDRVALHYSHDQNYWHIGEKSTFLSTKNRFVESLLNYISPEAATDFRRYRI